MNTSRKWIMIVCLVLIIALEVYLFKTDWNPIISLFSILITVTIFICFVYKQMIRSCEFLFKGGAGNGCTYSFFRLGNRYWKFPHIDVVSFDDALNHEFDGWRLATLNDFLILNEYIRIPEKENDILNVFLDDFSFYLRSKYWAGNSSNKSIAVYNYSLSSFELKHSPDQKAGVLLVRELEVNQSRV